MYKTYDEWKEIGYQVKRKEKSTKRNEKGEPVFSEEQVKDDPEMNEYGMIEDIYK